MSKAGGVSKGLLPLLFSRNPHAMWAYHAKTFRFLDVNEAAQCRFGYSRREFLRMTLDKLVLAEDLPAFRAVQLRFSGRAPIDAGVRRHKDKSGRVVWSHITTQELVISGEPARLSVLTELPIVPKATERALRVSQEMERDLRASEERFRRLYRGTPVMMYSIDTRGRIVSVSDYWLATLGYRRDEVIGRRSTDFLAPESRKYARKTVLPAFYKTGVCKDVPYRFLKKNGKEVDVLLSATAERDAQRRIVRSLAVLQDMTQRKRAEAELERSQRYWSMVLQQTPEFISCFDRRGRFLFVNRYARGVTPEQVIGKPVFPFLAPDSRRSYREAFDSVWRTGMPARLRTRGLTHDGAMAWYDTMLQPIGTGGKATAVLSVSRNITEEATTQARFEGVFNSSRDAMTYTVLDGTLLEVNPAYERMTGYERGELIGKKRYQDITPKEYAESDREALRNMMATGQPVEIEKEWIRKNGSRLPVQVTVFPVRGPDGKPAALASIGRDITERRRLEREVVRAAAREQSKLRHDLHNTLGQTLTGLSLLAKTLRVPKLVELSSLAVRQARGLARGLLPAELLGDGQGLPEALRQLALNAHELFGIQCTAKVPATLALNDKQDAVHLYHIAQEAVHNAAKHAHSKGGVHIRLSATRYSIRLEVIDIGVGIANSARRKRGLGLGLMEQHARLLGGQLTVRRRLTGGTRVLCVCSRQRALQGSP